ncbi:hypothetical protein [Planktothrix sp. FACHB-1365]|uniref:baeRF3 domain-containing protein n=1 Tax=Planktothrix sp. FACHB-1365 TaxID=2692855 RepID=UPI001689B9B5|nr:hypothetical protein [Planktothrix sp. FACHB-1365]MBD2482565.1 hypothetical protein [Planktothrix sp. FACHB-1365]
MSLLSVDELKSLVDQSKSSCVSLYMPTYRAGTEVQQNPTRFKNLIKQAETLLQEKYDLDTTEARAFLKPAMDLDIDDFWQSQDQGLAVFITQDFLKYYCLPLKFNEFISVSDRFHLKPLMPLLTGDGTFYLLGLSQQKIRFFEGSRYDIHEIELEDVPTNMDDALLYDETAKAGQFRISTSKGGTSNPLPEAGSYHGQGSPDRDKPQERILQFFHLVDQGLHKYLNGKTAPLIIAGVEYLFPLYKEANTYPHLVEDILPIDNLGVVKPAEFHQKALPLVEPYYTQEQQQAVEYYHNLMGTGKTSTDLQETISAAYYGRIERLFVAVGVQEWGNFDPQANQLQIHPEAEPGDDDLLNLAAVQTLLNGGIVYAVPPDSVPDEARLVAVFRY